MDTEYTIFTARITIEDSKKMKEVAKSRRLTQSGILREWITNSHRAFEAKKAKGKENE